MAQPITLSLYLPDKKDILSLSAGIRPCRQGGIRMQRQKLPRNKNLYHNYGHGGGGISVGYGCSLHVIDKYFLPAIQDSLPATVAVLGAGIIGLTTAYILIQKGFRVRIYANLLPFQSCPNKPQITTTVAAGYWMPIKVQNPELQKCSQDTWKHYSQIDYLQKQLNIELGISLLPTYSINDTQHLTYVEVPGIIIPKPCRIRFGKEGAILSAVTFSSYVIETENYIPYLMEKMQKSGKLTIIQRSLSTYEDILELPEDHIFNCFGLGSAMILPDEHSMKGIKGHVLKMKLNPKIADYILLTKHNQNWILQAPHKQSGTLCVGTTFVQNHINPFPEKAQGEKILKALKDFLEEASKPQLKPKL